MFTYSVYDGYEQDSILIVFFKVIWFDAEKKIKGWKTQQLEKLVRKKTNFTTVISVWFNAMYTGL